MICEPSHTVWLLILLSNIVIIQQLVTLKKTSQLYFIVNFYARFRYYVPELHMKTASVAA